MSEIRGATFKFQEDSMQFPSLHLVSDLCTMLIHLGLNVSAYPTVNDRSKLGHTHMHIHTHSCIEANCDLI